jgi:hypothetical protein
MPQPRARTRVLGRDQLLACAFGVVEPALLSVDRTELGECPLDSSGWSESTARCNAVTAPSRRPKFASTPPRLNAAFGDARTA